ncbi:MAG: YeeE/YedE thiosulfate transporter family protein, partial [Thermoanaerobaculia bacterium]
MSLHPPAERPFWNPYVAGVVLGLVLLGSFLVMGFGLGSSGGVTRAAVFAAHLVAPKAVETNAYFSQYFGPGKHVLEDWLVFEVLGVFLGGVLGAYSAGRLKVGVDKGPRATTAGRLALAVLGGVAMG